MTGLNPNVLFELAYAVAHRKRIWLLLDVAIEKAKLEFDRFQLFTTVGYQGASNSEKIVKGFFADQPYADDTNLCDELLDSSEKADTPDNALPEGPDCNRGLEPFVAKGGDGRNSVYHR